MDHRVEISLTVALEEAPTGQDMEKFQQVLDHMEDFIQREDYELFDSSIEEV